MRTGFFVDGEVGEVELFGSTVAAGEAGVRGGGGGVGLVGDPRGVREDVWVARAGGLAHGGRAVVDHVHPGAVFVRESNGLHEFL
jgi:hypothetical protein